MIAFATLLERLLFTQGRSDKIRLLAQFFASQPDPDRGLALAAIAGELRFPAAKAGLIRDLANARTDPVLFALSYDFVGDLAETVALIWPAAATNAAPPSLPEVVEALSLTPKARLPDLVAGWLDACDAGTRLALLKLITGGLRVGATGRLARVALADFSDGRATADAIEEVWHSLAPPYAELFAWLEGRGEKPDPATAPVFRPPMLAHPLEPDDVAALTPATLRAEWKWDGVRVQLVATPGGRRLYSRGAEDISATFPEIIAAMDFEGVLDGELLVIRDGAVAPFADLQQRLNRKTVGPKMLADYPAAVRLYDLLFDGADDLRPLAFDTRRARLEAWFARTRPARMDLSELIPFTTIDELAALREGARAASIEGLMLKDGTSPYLPGRPRGKWWKWKRAPLTIDAVLMYAQRGHGKRSGSYSDYTFGLWRDDGELVPVGKAYFGFTDRELAFLDQWIRTHTTARFGPVREVERGLVLEIAFDGAQRSSRHKSGVALRFPRIARLRTDKPASEADRLSTLEGVIAK
jgi:DNA ligase-1